LEENLKQRYSVFPKMGDGKKRRVNFSVESLFANRVRVTPGVQSKVYVEKREGPSCVIEKCGLIESQPTGTESFQERGKED